MSANANEGAALQAALSEKNFSSKAAYIPVTLIDGAWVKITLTCEQFRLVNYFTAIFNVGSKGYFKISPFYGVK